MLRGSHSRSRQSPSKPQHKRASSAPTPRIEVEDVSRPLINHEDLDPKPPRRSTTLGQRKKRHPEIEWRKKWSKSIDPFRNGRVLVVECYSRDASDDGKRKTQTQEFTNKQELNAFYEKGARLDKQHLPCLRIIHVQNAIWAREILFKRYGIFDQSFRDASYYAFSRWAQYEKPQRRAGRPVLNARAFRVDKNAWRRVWRAGFGADYLRYFTPEHMEMADEPGVEDFKLMGLNQWVNTEGTSYPAHGYDVYVQRLSVYLQRNMEDAGLAEDEWDDDPDLNASGELPTPEGEKDNLALDPPITTALKSFDNSSTVIFFESSHSGLVRDTLIEARNEIERKWRRVFSDLPRDDIASDSEVGLECMDIAIGYVLNGLVMSWEKFMSRCDDHVSILEEKIYENPADETKAPELWTNSSLWLKVEKLLSLQISAVNNFREYLKEISMDDKDFFRESPEQFKRIQTLLDEELVKPTNNLNDLMYKSVGIRDSRHSLQLGTSMWRLSWITFIFLPLSTLSAIFGMNVRTFQNSDGYPELYWYFIVAVPLLIIVVLAVNLLKSMVDLRAQDPIKRGAYETIYSEFTIARPDLWSRIGPRPYVKAKGFFSRIRWRLIQYWFDPTRTIHSKPISDMKELGLFARLKRWIAIIWLGNIQIEPSSNPLNQAEMGGTGEEEVGAVFEFVGVASTVAIAKGEPNAAVQAGLPLRQELLKRRSRSSRSSSGSGTRPNFRTTSPSNQSVMVEEEEDDDDEGRTPNDDDIEWQRGRINSREKAERRQAEEQSPATQGASKLLSIPVTSRQVLASSASTNSEDEKK